MRIKNNPVLWVSLLVWSTARAVEPAGGSFLKEARANEKRMYMRALTAALPGGTYTCLDGKKKSHTFIVEGDREAFRISEKGNDDHSFRMALSESIEHEFIENDPAFFGMKTSLTPKITESEIRVLVRRTLASDPKWSDNNSILLTKDAHGKAKSLMMMSAYTGSVDGEGSILSCGSIGRVRGAKVPTPSDTEAPKLHGTKSEND